MNESKKQLDKKQEELELKQLELDLKEQRLKKREKEIEILNIVAWAAVLINIGIAIANCLI